jgi:lipoyl(octanoyl) transferase
MAYALFDLRRVDMYVKEYVALLETAVIDTLDAMGVAGACRKPGAPGVYVPDPDGGRELAKIAALGIKIRNGRAYHGVSLNVAMDLAPFLGINPCGYAGLRTVDMASCSVRRDPTEVGDALARNLARLWRQARTTPA